MYEWLNLKFASKREFLFCLNLCMCISVSFIQRVYVFQLLENNDVTHLEDEPSPHVLRVGWSVLTASMLLGMY